MKIIAGIFKGRSLKTPKTATTRPTQGMLREAVFNMCQQTIEGARFLDLFAGSGAMGCEALSRGASQVTFVEHVRMALRCIQENLESLHITQAARILSMPASRAMTLLLKEHALFDLIYVDPPYDLSVDLSSLASLLAPDGTLFLEERYNPKKTPTIIPDLTLKDQRRFGAAQLSSYGRFK